MDPVIQKGQSSSEHPDSALTPAATRYGGSAADVAQAVTYAKRIKLYPLSNIMSFFQTPDSYPVDARGTAYTFAFFSAKHEDRRAIQPVLRQIMMYPLSEYDGTMKSMGFQEQLPENVR
jgi:hypothetical protein